MTILYGPIVSIRVKQPRCSSCGEISESDDLGQGLCVSCWDGALDKVGNKSKNFRQWDIDKNIHILTPEEVESRLKWPGAHRTHRQHG